jgi:hypothetical protein
MKPDVLNKMIEKAKGKKDGVYTMRGYYYLVKNGVVNLVAGFGKIVKPSPYGHFVTEVGSYSFWDTRYAEVKKMLIQEGE